MIKTMMIGRRVINRNDAVARTILMTMSLKTKMTNTTMTQKHSELSTLPDYQIRLF